MRTMTLHENKPTMHALVLDAGDEVTATLHHFAAEHAVAGASFRAIGGFCRATLGYFDIDRRDYRRIPVDEQVEVLSLVGDVSRNDGEPAIHAHAVLGCADGSTIGGHLLDAEVRPTLEVILTESPVYLRRVYRPRFGIALIDPTAVEPGHTATIDDRSGVRGTRR